MVRIQDLMTSPVLNARPEQTLAEAARTMQEGDIGFLPVTNRASGALEGVLSDRDICMTALRRGRPLNQIPVSDAMTRSVRSCEHGAEVATAHALMREHHVHRLPVTDARGRLVGVISIDDLARVADRAPDADLRAEVAETLRRVGHSHLRGS